MGDMRLWASWGRSAGSVSVHRFIMNQLESSNASFIIPGPHQTLCRSGLGHGKMCVAVRACACIDVRALFGLVRCVCNEKCCPVFSEIEYLGMRNHNIYWYIHVYAKYYVRKKQNTEEDFKFALKEPWWYMSDFFELIFIDSYSLHCFYSHRDKPHNLLHDALNEISYTWLEERMVLKFGWTNNNKKIWVFRRQ